MDEKVFISALRGSVSSVTLVTTVKDGVQHGLTATAVTSITADPPAMLCCINKSTSSASAFRTSGVFAINILGRQHLDIAIQFSSSKRAADRFTTGDWTTLETGAPVLSDAVAVFDCELVGLLPAYSHNILMGFTKAVIDNSETDALVYSRGAFGEFTPS